jgi:hypothetical protein
MQQGEALRVLLEPLSNQQAFQEGEATKAVRYKVQSNIAGSGAL